MTVTLGIREEAGRRTVSPRPLISLIVIHRGMKVFQVCFVMSVETGSMFLRITQNGESVQILFSACRALVR